VGIPLPPRGPSHPLAGPIFIQHPLPPGGTLPPPEAAKLALGVRAGAVYGVITNYIIKLLECSIPLVGEVGNVSLRILMSLWLMSGR
jgi:hypothetical protein